MNSVTVNWGEKILVHGARVSECIAPPSSDVVILFGDVKLFFDSAGDAEQAAQTILDFVRRGARYWNPEITDDRVTDAD